MGSGFKANYMDVTTSRGGLVSGIGNTVGSAGSTVGPLVVAHLRDVTGGWTAAFQSVALLSMASAVLFSTMSSTVPIEADEASANREPAVNRFSGYRRGPRSVP